MELSQEPVVRLAVAALAGVAVGMEREWSGHASGPRGRFAGIRTFLLYGLAAGIAGWLLGLGQVAAGTALAASLAAFAVVAWVRASTLPPGDDDDPTLDATTEVAALTVLGLGLLAGLGQVEIAAGGAAVVTLALREKERIRAFVGVVDAEELRAVLQFAVLALVILPLLPAGPYGPYDAIRPRELWFVVLVFSGLNLAGYLASRAIGAGRGHAVTGLLGGLVSSTAVTLGFSRRSRDEAGAQRALALGVVAASTVLLLRLGAVTLVLSRPVALHLVPYLLAPLLAGLGVMVVALRQGALEGGEKNGAQRGAPLGLRQAIVLAVLIQAALLGVEFAGDRLGRAGVSGLAFLLGLTNMDALTFSMARNPTAAGGTGVAAHAIAIGLLANTLLKGVVALTVGRGAFRPLAVTGLALLAAATGAVIVLLR